MKCYQKYGLFTGLLGSLWALSTFPVIGWLNSVAFHGSLPAARVRSIGGLFSIVILLIGIWTAMQAERRRGGWRLTYGRAVWTGVRVSIVVAAIVALFSWWYCTVIRPDLADFMVRDAEKTLRAAGKTQAEISPELESVRRQFSTGAQVFMSLAGQAVVGTVASLILALLIGNKNSNK